MFLDVRLLVVSDVYMDIASWWAQMYVCQYHFSMYELVAPLSLFTRCFIYIVPYFHKFIDKI